MITVDRADNLSHIIPSLEDWPINQFAKDRDGFIDRLIDFTLNRLLQSNSTPLELLSKSVYLERQRSKNNPWKVDPSDEVAYWKSLTKEVEGTKTAKDPESEQIKILKRVVHRYSEEILGDFNSKTFIFARKFLSSLFKRLLNNGWGRNHKGIWGSRDDVRKKIIVDGNVEDVRSLFNKGTVVIVPTHYSNLDSALIGYGVDMKLRIPAFAYGAGLNLYDYELVAYFINRLGAYRVDRRKKNPIYLETLKSMASLSLIEGVNHIFFPGGTRSRSGAIEEKLKLGLLNSVIDAQRYCILNNVNQKIFVVPVTLGYHFVLEAKALIDQHLRAEGKEKYARSRVKVSIFKSVFRLFKSLRKKDSEIYMSVGKPIDVLGNEVNETGESIDHRGQPVDISTYFSKDDVLNVDNQREGVYTKILADKIIKSFKQDNIILSSHMVAFAAFRCIEDSNEELGLYDILKIKPKRVSLNIAELALKIEKAITFINSENKDFKFSQIFEKSIHEIITDGIKNLGIYHHHEVLYWKNKEEIACSDLKLLYYYHNKLGHYDIPK